MRQEQQSSSLHQNHTGNTAQALPHANSDGAAGKVYTVSHGSPARSNAFTRKSRISALYTTTTAVPAWFRPAQQSADKHVQSTYKCQASRHSVRARAHVEWATVFAQTRRDRWRSLQPRRQQLKSPRKRSAAVAGLHVHRVHDKQSQCGFATLQSTHSVRANQTHTTTCATDAAPKES